MPYTPPIYPGAIPTIANLFGYADDTDWVNVEKWDAIRKELNACLETLGTNPEGGEATVDARIQALEDAPAPESDNIHDDDEDTAVETEKNADEDHVRMKVAGVEAFDLDNDGILTLAKNSSVRVYLNSAQNNIAQAQNVKVNFDEIVWDEQGEFDTVNHKFTAKVAGRYLFVTLIMLDDIDLVNGNGFSIILRINGFDKSIIETVFRTTTLNFNTLLVDNFYLSANDYVEVMIYSHDTAAADILPDIKQTFFSITKTG